MRKSELKFKLSALAFQVTQNAATEPPFTAEFFDFFEEVFGLFRPFDYFFCFFVVHVPTCLKSWMSLH